MIARWLTIKQAAIYANVTKGQIKRHLKEGRLLSMDFDGRKKVFIEPHPRRGQVLPNTATILQPLQEIDRQENRPILAASARILWNNALRRARNSARRYQWANAALCVLAVGLLGLASYAVVNLNNRLTTQTRRSLVLAHQLTQTAGDRDQTAAQLSTTEGELLTATIHADRASQVVDHMVLAAGSAKQEIDSGKTEYEQLLVSLDEMQQSREDDLKQMLDVQTELNSAQARISFLEGNKTVTVDNFDAQPAPLIKAAVATP